MLDLSRRLLLLPLGMALALAHLGGATALRAAGIVVRRWLLPLVDEVRVPPPLLSGARSDASGAYVRSARPRYVGWRDDALLSDAAEIETSRTDREQTPGGRTDSPRYRFEGQTQERAEI